MTATEIHVQSLGGSRSTKVWWRHRNS